MKRLNNSTKNRIRFDNLICLFRFFVPIIFIALSANLSAQIEVGGVIQDNNNMALPGVNIFEKGTTNGTISNVSGEYSITVNSTESILVFSFVGYVKQEVKVDNQTVINVTLKEDIESLEEVVVVGYGTLRKNRSYRFLFNGNF